MRSRIRVGLLSTALVLLATASLAGSKTHVGVKVGEIVNLSTSVIPGDNTPYFFHYDYSGPEFTVPEGWSFVVTDVSVSPNTSSFAPTDQYLVVVSFDPVGSRDLTIRFTGPAFYQALTTGFVVPGGTMPRARNLPDSSYGVVVQMNGYFLKGNGLPSNTPRF